jgi:hypothetical protein
MLFYSLPGSTMTDASRKQPAPCGAWTSPITAAVVAAGSSPLSGVLLDGADVYWLAGRASEGGRNTLLRRRAGQVEELTPAPFNVRTRVHEYGGGAALAADGTVWFSNFADNRIYRIDPEGGAPQPVSADEMLRYADFVLDKTRGRLVGVREDHSAGETYPVNTLCALGFRRQETILAEGNDFYSSPRIAPDGKQIAWISWDHPRMPWQGTELWLAEIGDDGSPARRPPDRRRRARGHRAAGVVAGRHAVLRVRPQRLVEPVPLRAWRGASGLPARGGIRRAALGVRQQHVRLRARTRRSSAPISSKA